MTVSREITFCIKTIHRPWSCARLVRSIRAHLNDPKIIVADDGRPSERFSTKYPVDAKGCEVINIDAVDSGVGVGRNAAVNAVQTELFFLFDDDHVVTPSLDMPLLLERYRGGEIDTLSVRQQDGGKPHMLTPIMGGRRLWMHKGEKRREGPLAWCDMGSNAMLANAELVREVNPWDDELKTYEHWEWFYRASRINNLRVCVATDCQVKHKHVGKKNYKRLRSRLQYRRMGLRKHGFDSMRIESEPITRA